MEEPASQQWLQPLILSIAAGLFVYLGYQLLYWLYDARRCGAAIDKFPGLRRHWLLGNLHQLHELDAGYMDWQYDLNSQYPRCMAFWWGPFLPTLTVSHPETAKMILRTSEPKPTGIGGFYGFIRPWIGQGLIASNGRRWARDRRLLTPAFHFDTLKIYVPYMNEAGEKLMKKFEAVCDSDVSFEISNPVSLYTLDVIMKSVLSNNVDCQGEGDKHPYVNAIGLLSKLLFKRALNPLLLNDTIYYLFTSEGRKFKKLCRYVHETAQSVLNKRRKELADIDVFGENKCGFSKNKSFLDILLKARDENGEGMSDEEIREHIDTIMFAGHDTTASSISWTLYALANHPDWQRKCQVEIDNISQDRNSADIHWEDLSKLETLSICIKEALRRYTPVPFLTRELTKKLEIDEVTLPPGTRIDINLYCLMNNKTVWDDPLSYRPERFLNQDSEIIDAYKFVPFSAGPRNCIGQHFAMNEVRVIIARILQRFNLEPDPNHKVILMPGIVLKSENGIRIKFTSRGKGNT